MDLRKLELKSWTFWQRLTHFLSKSSVLGLFSLHLSKETINGDKTTRYNFLLFLVIFKFWERDQFQ